MTHGSFFNGIGGFQIAARMIGWENVFSCEIDPFCNFISKYHFPNTIQHGDIKTTDFTIYKGRIDIVTGGFPCQPFSLAGKKKGTGDNRYLWEEMLRGIREVQPSWIVAENVRGLVNWSKGLVFDKVQADLEAEGYEVLPFLLPACSINAPHKRDRIFIIAYSGGIGLKRGKHESEQDNKKGGKVSPGSGSSQSSSDSYSFRSASEEYGNTKRQINSEDFTPGWFQNFPTESWLYRGNDGFPSGLRGISLSKWRSKSVEAYGNAIVPQLAYVIFKTIEQYESI